MKTAYLDCFSGISGDMFMGALLDAGLVLEDLQSYLNTVAMRHYRIDVQKEKRNHISGTRFSVEWDAQHHTEANLSYIRTLIRDSGLPNTIKEKGIELFSRLAEVEGRIHDLPPDKVHFHEVGAVDSIVDILGALIGMECMEIQSLHVSPIPLGKGFIQTAHGTLPVPAPATMEMLKDIPVYDSGVNQEMVTPTGATLVKCLGTSFGPMPPMVVCSVGYGVGKRVLPDRPNMLRILVGHPSFEPQVETVVVLETNLDNTNPEWVGHLMDRLMSAGALDVSFFPIQMKKNRPGVQIQVIGRADHRQNLTDIIFRESRTLGVRFRYSQREILKREEKEVDSPWGKLRVKQIFTKEGMPSFRPEYDACRKIALEQDIPLKEIYEWVAGLNKK